MTIGKEEKVMASRGCFYGGGSVSSEAFCTNITKIDPDADCHFCRPDACNTSNEMKFSPLLIMMVVVLNAVTRFCSY